MHAPGWTPAPPGRSDPCLTQTRPCQMREHVATLARHFYPYGRGCAAAGRGLAKTRWRRVKSRVEHATRRSRFSACHADSPLALAKPAKPAKPVPHFVSVTRRVLHAVRKSQPQYARSTSISASLGAIGLVSFNQHFSARTLRGMRRLHACCFRHPAVQRGGWRARIDLDLESQTAVRAGGCADR